MSCSVHQVGNGKSPETAPRVRFSVAYSTINKMSVLLIVNTFNIDRLLIMTNERIDQ
jgi:hypothetical protein